MAKMNWLARYKFYFLAWIALAAYWLLADQLYIALFVKNGTAVREPAGTFETAGSVKFAVDQLIGLRFEGQEIYELRGWAFSPEITNLDDMEMKLVLRSDQEDLIFPRLIWPRKSLTGAMPEYAMDLEQAGYRVLIAKQTLRVAKYEIGILLMNKNTGEQHFKLTGFVIERTPNHVRLLSP